jgi:hypothetical protein
MRSFAAPLPLGFGKPIFVAVGGVFVFIAAMVPAHPDPPEPQFLQHAHGAGIGLANQRGNPVQSERPETISK